MAARADIALFLEAGSTITPTCGVAEALTGSLVLADIGANGSLEVFNAIALNLHSASFTLTLDTSPASDEATSLFPDGTSYFTEVVDAQGFANTILDMESLAPGSYSGTIQSPATLAYSDIGLFPNGGGPLLARIDFTAFSAPEPSTLTLTSLGLVGMAAAALEGRQRINLDGAGLSLPAGLLRVRRNQQGQPAIFVPVGPHDDARIPHATQAGTTVEELDMAGVLPLGRAGSTVVFVISPGRNPPARTRGHPVRDRPVRSNRPIDVLRWLAAQGSAGELARERRLDRSVTR